ncbi:surface-adhesin E family protein [Acinetobacter zhairhuonensis]|uniref:surface-adhesin E family protein n=1 Tax=Acinetobacter sp. A7.4 TaxID=2919921 RepID=UPI001F4FDC21|nr:surface-adhesin E family protein [Acinetobacter sp. A7.4]MCJ8163145.1 hypothetical protein [Acinetobacter sp. A7.4]
MKRKLIIAVSLCCSTVYATEETPLSAAEEAAQMAEYAADQAAKDATATESYESSNEAVVEAVKKMGWLNSANSVDQKFELNLNYFSNKSNESSTRIQAWVKSIITKDTVQDGLGIGDYTMLLKEFDCTNNTIKDLRSISYKAKTGTVINSSVVNYPKVDPIIPDTVGEQLHKDVCETSDLMNS